MPQYSGTHATPRMDLGVAMNEYDFAGINYIGPQVLPIFPTPKKAGTFSVITRESMLRGGNLERAAGSGYNIDDFQGEDLSYACKEYGTTQLIDDSQRAMYASDFDCDLVAAQVARNKLMRAEEIRCAAAIFNTTTWTGATLYTNTGTVWTTGTTDVCADVNNAKEKVRVLTGMLPNTLIMNSVTFNALLNNDDLMGRIQYTQRATQDVLAQFMAAWLGVERILVGNAVRNSADEGLTFTSANVWSSLYAMVAVLPRTQSLAEPCVGRTMLWTDDSPSIVTVEQYRIEERRSDGIRMRQHVQEKVFDASFAHLMEITAA